MFFMAYLSVGVWVMCFSVSMSLAKAKVGGCAVSAGLSLDHHVNLCGPHGNCSESSQTTFSCSNHGDTRNVQVHIVASRGGAVNRTVTITGDSNSKPFVLVLVPYEFRRWKFDMHPAIKINTTVVISQNESEVISHYYARISAIHYYSEHSWYGFGAYGENVETVKLLKFVNSMYQTITSFTGSSFSYRWNLNVRGTKSSVSIQPSFVVIPATVLALGTMELPAIGWSVFEATGTLSLINSNKSIISTTHRVRYLSSNLPSSQEVKPTLHSSTATAWIYSTVSITAVKTPKEGKIGLLFASKGASSSRKRFLKEISLLAIKDLTASRAGPEVTSFEEDTEGSPKKALSAFKKLYQEEQVKFFVGLSNSEAVEVAAWAEVNAYDTLILMPDATTTEFTKYSNVVQLSTTNQALAHAVHSQLVESKVSVFLLIVQDDTHIKNGVCIWIWVPGWGSSLRSGSGSVSGLSSGCDSGLGSASGSGSGSGFGSQSGSGSESESGLGSGTRSMYRSRSVWGSRSESEWLSGTVSGLGLRLGLELGLGLGLGLGVGLGMGSCSGSGSGFRGWVRVLVLSLGLGGSRGLVPDLGWNRSEGGDWGGVTVGVNVSVVVMVGFAVAVALLVAVVFVVLVLVVVGVVAAVDVAVNLGLGARLAFAVPVVAVAAIAIVFAVCYVVPAGVAIGV